MPVFSFCPSTSIDPKLPPIRSSYSLNPAASPSKQMIQLLSQQRNFYLLHMNFWWTAGDLNTCLDCLSPTLIKDNLFITQPTHKVNEKYTQESKQLVFQSFRTHHHIVHGHIYNGCHKIKPQVFAHAFPEYMIHDDGCEKNHILYQGSCVFE